MSETGSLRSFRHRNFQILFAANAVSNIGTWAQRIAQDWLVLELTHKSGRDLGFVTGLQFLPFLLLSMYGGVLADRFNKRRLLLITNLGGGLTSLILGGLDVTHHIQIWHVYLLALTLGIFNALDNPVRQSFNSEVVGKDDVANAISLNSANFNAGRLVGPGLSGLSIAWFGTGPSFLLNGASYLGVMFALYSIDESKLHIEKEPKPNAKLFEAFRYVKRRPDILAIMITIFFAATFGLNFQIFNALMATKIFGKGAAVFGGLGSILAIGSLAGALISAKIDRKHGPRFITFFAACFGGVEMILSVAPTYLTYAALLPIVGFFALTTLIAANSFVQISADPEIRGRVMGIYLLVFMGGTPFGSPLIGWMCGVIGVRETVAICGAITLMSSTAMYFVFQRRQHKPLD